MTDSEIEQWVLREFKFAEQIHSRELCVSVHQGIVTLGGTVPNRLSKAMAKRAALRARGVQSVVNNLRALPFRKLRETERVVTKAARSVTAVMSQPATLSDPIGPPH
jgi:BON domain-containing protein